MPPVAALTIGGDTALPRVAAPGKNTLSLALGNPGARTIVTIKPFKDFAAQLPVSAAGDNAEPAVSYTGQAVAWDTDDDPLGTSLPGRQVVLWRGGQLSAASSDPTGTSSNASVDASGARVVYESNGDLAGTGNPGARQVFLRNVDGSVLQLSAGVGTSRNPVLSAKKGFVAFESTSHPGTGADTGVAQIWFGVLGGPMAPLTAGAGPSRNPQMSDDSRLLTFESEADLAGAGAATGVPQIFIHDMKTRTYAQVTNDPQGCTLPGVAKVRRDWRIAFVCGGTPYFYMLRAEQLFEVQAAGGPTQRIIPELGIHFLALSTRANLLGSGATPGNQVYIVNVFKRPPLLIGSMPATWWPVRGINPL